MVRASNPKLMARVLEAVDQLGEGKGSLARDVLRYVKQNSVVHQPRNLTMQVRRALKHAVTAGLLRCKSNRYKMQLDLNRVSRRRKNYDDSDVYKNNRTNKDTANDQLPTIVNAVRKSAPRTKSSRNRSAVKAPSGARGRGAKGKLGKRRGTTAAADRRSRLIGKQPRHKSRTTGQDDTAEDWPTRKRRMMAKPKYNEKEDDEDGEEEEEEEEDDDEEEDVSEGEDEEEEEEEATERRKELKEGFPKMRSVNEDRYSDFSGDGCTVGRHRSRRSKHLARAESPSPSRRGNGDADGHQKSRRSNSRRRRSQPRKRESRQIPTEEPLEDEATMMEDEQSKRKNSTRMDDDHQATEGSGTPPDNHQPVD